MTEQELLSRVNELPKVPSVVQELVNMLNDPDCDFSMLSKKIAMDQVISARVLRLSNSAHFGRSRTIASINEAVIRLGIAPLKTMIVVSWLTSSFPRVNNLNMREFWSDTFEIASIASAIAEKVRIDPNEMFTAGILHNIGDLMVYSLTPELATKIAEREAEGEDPQSVQLEVLGTTTAKLGAELARLWKFAPRLVDTIEFHVNPDAANIEPLRALVLHFACQLHKDWDQLESKAAKIDYFASHANSGALVLPSSFYVTIDKIRGQGREMAEQMAG
ncbi:MULTISPECIES: HDOD domain-containing protein [unclassified Agarivorans]|uniref:HDOD domain-containing protein n=1 Tax=unclassified Agarivorans TaxID=2636026 RepID=UPI0026E18EF9|nr:MULTISPECIES: HDOD domain-containing protein [unclassified Agarivorans]MDO6685218.1 HDOD domain-containing protein [Agarivorans sp. 3_MG-2023]MDO6715610.1 HDOD domain-containing protein [Agarivorans sp. 2_MG-2023]MDO6763762.1 HDOD domain-containing protein [Agarivorans sp. 1_MG-2023]